MTMKKARVADLKARLSEYLRSVKRGHEVTVFDRDQPIAKIIPYAAAGPLVVREPIVSYRTLGDIPMPPPVNVDVDIVDLLLEDRQSGR